MSQRTTDMVVAILACIGLANVCALFVLGSVALFRYVFA